MAKAILNSNSLDIKNDAMEQAIITDYFQGKRGGVSLDWTGFTGTYIQRGHVIIHNPAVVDSHRPMPVTADGGAYGTLPENYAYYGFAVNGALKGEGLDGVMVRGNRNPLAFDNATGYYNMAAILTAVKASLPLVTFLGDNQ